MAFTEMVKIISITIDSYRHRMKVFFFCYRTILKYDILIKNITYYTTSETIILIR